MRISDWSSDVCSSDLLRIKRGAGAACSAPSRSRYCALARLCGWSTASSKVRTGAKQASVPSNNVHQSSRLRPAKIDRKSTRLNPVTNAQLVCRLLLEKKKHIHKRTIMKIYNSKLSKISINTH